MVIVWWSFATNPDYGVVGNPSTVSLGLSIASLENDYMRSCEYSCEDFWGWKNGAHILSKNSKNFNPNLSLPIKSIGKALDSDIEGLDLTGYYAVAEREGKYFWR